MYDLHLSSEQLEFRDTVRDFVNDEVTPVTLKADRLDTATAACRSTCCAKPRRWDCGRWRWPRTWAVSGRMR